MTAAKAFLQYPGTTLGGGPIPEPLYRCAGKNPQETRELVALRANVPTQHGFMRYLASLTPLARLH